MCLMIKIFRKEEKMFLEVDTHRIIPKHIQKDA